MAFLESPAITRSNQRTPQPCSVRWDLWQYHRGPDGWGEWISDGIVLAQNRLAILGSRSRNSLWRTEDGSVQVVFNGEIYNFSDLWSDLASKGYQFRTDHSDTEVIVHGYSEWGKDVLNRLEGMFAIAIWDASSQSLLSSLEIA